MTLIRRATSRLKFLDHLILGSPECEDGKGFVSIEEIG